MRLHLALGASSAASALIEKYRTAEKVYAHLSDIDASDLPGASETVRKLRAVPEQRAEETLAVCREFNWQIVTAESPLYPQSLRAIRDFPVLLYAAGNLNLLSFPCMAAVVGTRSATEEGKGLAYGIGRTLAENGVLPVSGCACGIDHAAQSGAISCGATVGVLGNGFGYNYLPEYVFFRRRIIRQGLLLTELAPFTAPSRYTFPRRNRIIAGLCACVIVVQSGRKGGSLITADYAQKQTKTIFVPQPTLLSSEGAEALLEKGAQPLEDLEPVLALFRGRTASSERKPAPLAPYRDAPPAELFPARGTLEDFAFASGVSPAEAAAVYRRFYAGTAAQEKTGPVSAGKPAPSRTKPAPTAQKKTAAQAIVNKTPAPSAKTPALTGDVKVLFDAVSTTPQTLDALVEKTLLGVSAAMKAATRLELLGLIKSLPGNMLVRT